LIEVEDSPTGEPRTGEYPSGQGMALESTAAVLYKGVDELRRCANNAGLHLERSYGASFCLVFGCKLPDSVTWERLYRL
jgi:hypothetical protein